MCDYRNTKYCKPLKEVENSKENLELYIKQESPKTKIMYNRVKESGSHYNSKFLEMYNFKCAYCGVDVLVVSSTKMEVDHFVNVKSFDSKEEAGKLENLVLSCYDCNRSKGDIIVKDEYKNRLHPDLELSNVFVRDDEFYIRIKEDFKDDYNIRKFYEKLKLDYHVRRLDYLVMNLHGMVKECNDAAKRGKLSEILAILQSKRNLTGVFIENKINDKK